MSSKFLLVLLLGRITQRSSLIFKGFKCSEFEVKHHLRTVAAHKTLQNRIRLRARELCPHAAWKVDLERINRLILCWMQLCTVDVIHLTLKIMIMKKRKVCSNSRIQFSKGLVFAVQ